MQRLEQLLGVVALAATDRFRHAMEQELGLGGAAPGALVHIQAWPGGSINDLSRVVGLSQPATVRLVDRLVERGLVSRAGGEDGRTRALACTSQGAALVQRMLGERSQHLGGMLAGLSDGEREQLEGLLDRLVGGLVEDRQAALSLCRMCDRSACQGEACRCPLNHTNPGR